MQKLKGSLLITGGTGSFGTNFVKNLLDNGNLDKIIIYSRDELKQSVMRAKFNNDERLRFFLGDVRDKDRLEVALKKVDFLIHAAALKQVDTAEYNPYEFVKTNIIGTQNVIEASIKNEVNRVLTLSTDKASSPINLYGATKLTADKLTVAANHFSTMSNTKFSVIRYGNVAGSRGSIFPLLEQFEKNMESLPLTNKEMTRFWITFEKAINFVRERLSDMVGGELFVPKIPSVRIIEMFETLFPKRDITIIGTRPGEKIHEEMISIDDSYRTYDLKTYYVVHPTLALWGNVELKGKKVEHGFQYRSDLNSEFLDSDTIKKEYIDFKLKKNEN